MSRRASGLIVAALVLVTVFAVAAASARKPAVTPKLGIYFGQLVGKPEGGSVSVRETEVKVTKLSRRGSASAARKRRGSKRNKRRGSKRAQQRRGAAVRVSPFPATCTGGFKDGPWGLSVLEKSPIPIKNGKFKLDRTGTGPVSGGAGTATTRTVVKGTFKSPTKVVVSAFVTSSISVQYPGQPEIKGTCTGRQTTVARHK